jgi:hypothetical protein
VIAQLRYNLKIVAPTMIWTGALVTLMVALTLFGLLRGAANFTLVQAGSVAEDTVPLIAAFFAAGVLDAEMKRGAHELLCSKRRPLWHTVAFRVAVAIGIALLIGLGMLLALHFGAKRLPIGMLLLAAFPSALVLALVSLWTRIRLGNAFIGYMVALGAWLGNTLTTGLLSIAGISLNPLLTLTSYSDRLKAEMLGAVATTPYVDWWWVSKIALLLVSVCVFLSITRRVELLVEGD